MTDQPNFDTLLRRVYALGRELKQLRRELLRGLAGAAIAPTRKPTLYGSVHAGAINDEVIGEAQREVLRPLDDL